MDDDKHSQQLGRLAQARQRAQERLDAQQQRSNNRFNVLEDYIVSPVGKLPDTRTRIISAALDLLDEEGLNELSLRKLAAKVNLKAPALYWYFKNKEELVDYMAEAILIHEFADLTPRADNETWQDWLILLCIRLRKAMLSHRDGARIVAGAHLVPAVTLAQLFETADESMSSSGLDEQTIDMVVGTAVHFTFGRVIEEQSSPTVEEIRVMDYADIAAKFPRLARNIQRIQADGSFNGFGDEGFEQSLRLIIR